MDQRGLPRTVLQFPTRTLETGGFRDLYRAFDGGEQERGAESGASDWESGTLWVILGLLTGLCHASERRSV